MKLIRKNLGEMEFIKTDYFAEKVVCLNVAVVSSHGSIAHVERDRAGDKSSVGRKKGDGGHDKGVGVDTEVDNLVNNFNRHCVLTAVKVSQSDRKDIVVVEVEAVVLELKGA